MENLFSFIPFAAIVVAAVFAALYSIDEKLAKKIAIRTAMFIVAVVAFALVLTLHGTARAEWVEATVIDSIPAVYEGEKCYLVSVNINGEEKSYYSSQNLAENTIIEVDYVNGKIENSREPEPIWFPPFCFIGALVAPVVNKSKKYKLAQTMPPDLYLPCKVWEIQVSIVYYVNNSRSFNTIALDQTIIKALKSNKVQDVAEAYSETVDKALNLLNRATAKKVPAYIVAYVPAYKQMAVVACNYVGFLEYWRNTAISDKVSAANALLRRDIQIIPETAEHKPTNNEPHITRSPATDVKVISDKDDPVKMIVKVKYSKSCNKLYTFTCRSAHFIGDYVTVEYNNGRRVSYKNAEVGFVGTMKQSELNKLAESLGRKEIAEVYCEQAIDTEEAWEEWGGKDPRISTVNPEDDPELYAPSAEEIADFEAMRETMLGSGYRDF